MENIVTLTVAECSEFHDMGVYYENIPNVKEAIRLFNSIPPERLNGIRAIGINLHEEGTDKIEDEQLDIYIGKTLDTDMLMYYTKLNNSEKVKELIRELEEELQ